ncbi:MAG: C4-dicarboxylate ABC transporter [Alphaproteobacteria bacterium]|nr:C4-dicarboxylate ABC transporter [Alphaproteobacteria bacterium]
MQTVIGRRGLLGATLLAAGLVFGAGATAFGQELTLRFSTPASETDLRSVGLEEIFAEGVKDFAVYQPHYNATFFAQGTELEAIARGNLEMAITSAQELAQLIPDWSIFTAGYLIRDSEHQRAVFDGDIGAEMYQLAADQLGVKLLSVMYFGTRQLNLRGDKKINTPEDLAGVKLRMPGTDAWQFLGKALGANPTPLAFTEVFTSLGSGAIDGQDNPLPTVRDRKFYEVTDQIILTSHLVDGNFLALSLEVWDGLTADQQDQLQTAARAASLSISANILAVEEEIVEFFRSEGLEVYTPDVDAFRTRVQNAYLESEFSANWPEGMLERVNAAGQ